VLQSRPRSARSTPSLEASDVETEVTEEGEDARWGSP